MKNREASLYSCARDNRGRETTLAEVLAKITSGELAKPTQAIREKFKAELNKGRNEKKAKKAVDPDKHRLPACTFSGRFEMRATDRLIEHTGLLVADLDLLKDDQIADLRERLQDDPHVVFFFTSPTGRGMKVGVRVPDGLDENTHKSLGFQSMRAYAKGTWDVKVDESGKDVCRLCFLSHDPELYLNWDAEPLSTEWARQSAARKGKPQGIVVSAQGAGGEESEEVAPAHLQERREAIEGIFPEVEWVAEHTGQMECPGIHHHTTGDRESDCQIYLRGKGKVPPLMFCFHGSCREEVGKANARIWAALARHSREAGGKHLEHLARMPSSEYDRVRKYEAKQLDIRTTTLDKEVKGKRKEAGKPNPFDDGLDPWPEPVQTAELLDELVADMRRFVYAPDHHLHTLACAVLHTWAIDAFAMTFRVMIQSPEFSCGKTVLLELLEKLVRNPFKSENATQAVLYHIIHKHSPTVLLDEVDSLSPEHREAMVNVLNAGNRRGAQVWRVEGEGGERDARCYNCFAPIVVAGIGRHKFPPATVSRAIVLRMTRKPQDHKTERPRRYDPAELRRKCRRWAMDRAGHLRDCQPELPEELSDRQQDVWESLFAIAEDGGGQWPDLIREAALKLHNISADEMESPGNELLRQIKAILDEGGEDRIHTKNLLEKLNDLDEAGYGGWNNGKGIKAKDLNKKLAEYEIKSRKLRIGDDNRVGFTRDQFSEAWNTYLTAPVPCSSTSGGGGAQEHEPPENPEKGEETPKEIPFEVDFKSTP